MYFKDFSLYLKRLEHTALRNEMTEILALLFKKLSPEEIDKACYLCLGRLAPKYEGIEFNLAEKMMKRALAIVFKTSVDKITKAYKEKGDLGQVALEFKNQKLEIANKNSKLSINDVYGKLKQIAEDKGKGSVDRKIKKMAELLNKTDNLSAKYIVRVPINKLRLGFSDMTILDALSWMEKKDKSLRPQLEQAFNVLADIGKIARIFKIKGLKGIKDIKGETGIPIRPALAERLAETDKILEKMDGRCILEPKIDGFRCQIHMDKNKREKMKNKEQNLELFEKEKEQYFVRIFSRNLDNITHMFPDIVKAIQTFEVNSIILDGEAIAYNPRTNKFLPFQETIQRKRKHNIAEKSEELPLKVFIFDLLYLNGRSCLKKTFLQRRKLLEMIFKSKEKEKATILLAKQKIVSKAEDFDLFFHSALDEHLEGLMAKKPNAFYQAGRRNFNWIKYKAGMQSELADTIDCVVMGYYQGKGKRTDFGIGAFLVGVVLPLKEKLKIKNKKLKAIIADLNTQTEYAFLTVSKIGTGLTDKQWREIYKQCFKLKTDKKPLEYIVDKNLYPDVWCDPKLVVEIEADMITKSPIHTAGLALRFPRLKKIRNDKDVRQANTLNELKKLADRK